MKIFVVLAILVAEAAAFDCTGQNSSCTKCHTGLEPFCEFIQAESGGHPARVCTCDKACNTTADCLDPSDEDGCQNGYHAECFTAERLCYCNFTTIYCSTVQCGRPECDDPFIPEGECCPICPEPCVEDGIIYQSGQSFLRECNRCTCMNGRAGCTKMYCGPGCYRNGTRYDKGDEVPGNNPCEKDCKCYLERSKYKIGCYVDLTEAIDVTTNTTNSSTGGK